MKLLALLCALLLLPCGAGAAGAWLPYWDAPAALEEAEAFAPRLDRACVFAASFNGADRPVLPEEAAELLLDMPVVLMESNPNVADNGGKAAVMRGPVVYCMEAKDNGERIFDCMIDAVPEACIAYSEDYRMPIIKAKGWRRPAPEGDWLYRPLAGRLEQTELIFIPYYAMANRGESDMRVWIPVKY